MSARAKIDRACALGCGSLEADGSILRDNRFGLPHAVRIGWCSRCGLGMTLDPPSREELHELYAQTYVDEAAVGRVPRTGRLARAWHRVNGSLPLTDLDLASPVLDVGSNTGEALEALRRRGIDAVGLEPNPRGAALAAARGLDVIAAPIEESNLPDEHFMTVLLSQVLEHVDDPESVLRVVRRSLRPGGAAYAIVPNANSAWRVLFGANWVHWHVPFHLFHFTPSSVRLLFERAGFEVRRVRHVTPGEWILLSLQAARNARLGVWRLDHFEGRYGRRLLVAPLGRLADVSRRGDALLVEAVRPQ